jgi:hypothetical protein
LSKKEKGGGEEEEEKDGILDTHHQELGLKNVADNDNKVAIRCCKPQVYAGTQTVEKQDSAKCKKLNKFYSRLPFI